jgi:hypothetical protein
VFRGKLVSHKWKCEKHQYISKTTLKAINDQNGNIRCCGRDFMRGSLHPRYNPNINDEWRDKHQKRSELKLWANSVKKRDDFKCMICSSTNNPEAHHLYSYMAHPNDRYDINNGVTLCKEHHIEFHKIYGVMQTTPDDYYDYVKKKMG